MAAFEPPNRLFVRPWVEPMPVPAFRPTSLYVEYCWLPVIGPSATWLYRHLGDLLTVYPTGILVDLPELATDHGLGGGLSRHSPFTRSLGRLVRFGLARSEDDMLFVRPTAPGIPAHERARLSPALQATERHLRSQAGGA